jgi:hypothetical protein
MWWTSIKRGLMFGMILLAFLIAPYPAGLMRVRSLQSVPSTDESGRIPSAPWTLESTAHASEPPKADAPPDLLASLNDTFRAAYRQTRADVLARSGPVILVEGDTLVLKRDGRRTEIDFTPRLYHELKGVSHVPLALYVMLADGPLSDERLTALRRYREQADAAHGTLEKRGFSAESLKRQQQIFTASLAFLDKALERKQVSSDDLTAFAREMAPLVLADAEESARLQIDALHAHVTAWRKQMSTDEWKRLHVVVMGSAMPRKGHIAVQYFAKLLGEPGEGRRIIYAEAQWDEGKALDLLGTHLLDTDIGAVFFKDDQRMHRDLLADATAEYLQKMTFEP